MPIGSSNAQQSLANKHHGVKVRRSCISCRVQGLRPDNRASISLSTTFPGTRHVQPALAQKLHRRLVSVASFQDTYGGVYEDEGPGSVGWAPFTSERFQFQELLGKGGWGTVHLALDTQTGQQVAIKSQTKWRRQEAGKKSPSQEVVLQRISNEGDLLHYMQRSKRVVKLLHRMEDRDNAYIITEVLEGGDLESAFNGHHHLSEPYAAMLLREVLLFLRDCHNSSICFSDVKPANFMLTEDEDGRPMVKAIDFGCAQVYTPGEPLQNRRGTPIYFSPEMFQRCYGLEADIWGAGVMLYRFLSGRFPWFDTDDTPKRISPARIQGAVLAMPITFSAAPWNFKSESAVSLLKGMLSRDPEYRLTVDGALKHPWITKFCPDNVTDNEPCVVADEDEVEGIRQQLRNNVVPASNLPPVSSTSSRKSSVKEPLAAR